LLRILAEEMVTNPMVVEKKEKVAEPGQRLFLHYAAHDETMRPLRSK